MDLLAKLPLDTLLSSSNIAEHLEEGDRKTIAAAVWNEWNIDKQSRAEWEERMKFSFGLALQVAEKKTFPWPGAANVKLPLITIAAMQYQARAYPALLPSPDIVKCRAFGEDETGELYAKAERIASHMSYQLLEEDTGWEEDTDAALIAQSIVGAAFKKTYFSPSLGHNVSEHVFAKDLYISYYAKSLEAAPRLTQVLYFSRNDLEQRRRSGLFLEWETGEGDRPAVVAPESLDEARDEQTGLHPQPEDPSAPFRVLEQHRWLDLDGDGFEEPYVVSVREDTQTLLRVVARFRGAGVKHNAKGEITHITPIHYFTRIPFIPSPDGGIYGLGFGALLSPLNESINSSINLLLDAGTVANTAGGFLGRGVKFRSGEHGFRPWEWKRTDSSGDDLRKGIFPLPVREPSQVVFALLKLLIDYGERVGMATDPQVGVPTGQNTPAETSRNMIREGQRVFSAIYKRTYRALRDEFRKLYELNKVYLEQSSEYFDEGKQVASRIFKVDYSLPVHAIVPAADPAMSSEEEQGQRAQILAARAQQVPGYNRYEVEKRLLGVLKIPNIDAVYPDPKGPNAIPPPPNPKVIVEQMKLESRKYEIQMNLQLKMAELMQDAELNSAKILELRAKAVEHMASADGVQMGHEIARIDAVVGALKAKQDGIFSSMKMVKEMMSMMQGEQRGIDEGRMGGLAIAAGNKGSVPVPAGTPGGGQGSVGAGF